MGDAVQEEQELGQSTRRECHRAVLAPEDEADSSSMLFQSTWRKGPGQAGNFPSCAPESEGAGVEGLFLSLPHTHHHTTRLVYSSINDTSPDRFLGLRLQSMEFVVNSSCRGKYLGSTGSQ